MKRHATLFVYLTQTECSFWAGRREEQRAEVDRQKARVEERSRVLNRPIELVATDGQILWEVWPRWPEKTTD